MRRPILRTDGRQAGRISIILSCGVSVCSICFPSCYASCAKFPSAQSGLKKIKIKSIMVQCPTIIILRPADLAQFPDEIPYPDIEFSGEEPLRNSDRVEDGAGDVEAAHEDEPSDGRLVHRLVPTVDHAVVRGRCDAREAERDEDTGAEGAESVGGRSNQRAQMYTSRAVTNNFLNVRGVCIKSFFKIF